MCLRGGAVAIFHDPRAIYGDHRVSRDKEASSLVHADSQSSLVHADRRRAYDGAPGSLPSQTGLLFEPLFAAYGRRQRRFFFFRSSGSPALIILHIYK